MQKVAKLKVQVGTAVPHILWLLKLSGDWRATKNAV
jgi:hypothetical protein